MTMEDVARFRERFIAQVDATQASALRHWRRSHVVHATSHYSGFSECLKLPLAPSLRPMAACPSS